MKDNKLLKNDFWKSIMDKIKKDKVKQIPKNIFILKNIFIWIFLVLSIFIWALSLSISFEYLFNADWSLLHRLWVIKIAIIFMPILWFVFLILASILSYFNFRHTDDWYKSSFKKIFIINIVLSILLWLFIYILWINNFIEWKIEDNMPQYRKIFVKDKTSRMIEVWQNEEKWLLIWRIIEVNIDNLDFKDFNNKNWSILLNSNTKTDIKHKVYIKKWEKIKLIWEKIDSNIFKAIEIRPFIGRKNKF